MISKFERFSSTVSFISRCIQKIERVEMAKYGLKGPHAQCLLAMERYPEGITASQLCEICDKDKAAISRTIAELEQANMVQRNDPDGKRYRAQLKLTEQGKVVAEHVNELTSQAVKRAIAGVEYQQGAAFFHVLNLVADNLQIICRDGLQKKN